MDNQLELLMAAAGRQLGDLGLPKGALLVLVSRDDEFAVPQGATVLRPGDWCWRAPTVFAA